MTSPNTIIADLTAEVESLRKQRESLVHAMKEIYNLRPFGLEATEYAITVEDIAREALGSVQGGY